MIHAVTALTPMTIHPLEPHTHTPAYVHSLVPQAHPARGEGLVSTVCACIGFEFEIGRGGCYIHVNFTSRVEADVTRNSGLSIENAHVSMM